MFTVIRIDLSKPGNKAQQFDKLISKHKNEQVAFRNAKKWKEKILYASCNFDFLVFNMETKQLFEVA